MGFIKQAKSNTISEDAARARDEGRSVFVTQIRGPMSHSPALSRPIPQAAESIEAVEEQGWRLDKMDSLVYNNNTTLVCLFRRLP